MELWVEARALKPSLRGEIMAMKPSKQVVSDEFLCLDRVSSAEDFSVECFLDLSNGGFEEVVVEEDEEEEEEEEEQEEEEGVTDSCSQEQTEDDNSSNSRSLSNDSFLTDELILPVDEIAELEWVSRFVDDSLPEQSSVFPERKAKPENQTPNRSEPEAVKPVLSKKPYFYFPVPVKPRTKRTRTSNTEPVSLSFGSIAPISGSLILKNTVEPAKKRPKTKPGAARTDNSSGGNMFQRRCSHCRANKTPQWRTGPLGSKTLCNACGVRYKSGRLCPEYRPVGSPTFSSELHSNSHRKVLQLRKRRQLNEPGQGLFKPGQHLAIE